MNRRIKKIIIPLILVVSLFGSTLFAYGADATNENLLPLREAFESQGIKVEWVNNGKNIKIGSNSQISMKIGSKTVNYDGISYEMSEAPKIIGGKTYVDKTSLEKIIGIELGDSTKKVPSYMNQLLTNDYKTKVDLYQTPVAGEKEFIGAINPQTGWDVAKELVKIGSSKDGFRTGGTPEGKAAADLVFEKYKEVGLNPEYDQFKLYGWRYLGSSFKLQGNSMEIPVVSSVGTKATPKGGITAPVVFVGGATKQDLEGVDLTGKIALIAVDLDTHPWQAQAAHAATLHGAIGVIYYCENSYGQYEGFEAFNVQDWSGPEIDIPVLNTPKKYGLELKKLVGGKAQTATLISDVTIDENADGYNVIGKIEGTKYPNEFIMVNAHTDAYFQGFQDDSIAIGAMVSFAEAMKKSGYKPDRSILFLSCDAEEFGAMDMGTDWLIGSWNLMEGKGQQWVGKTIASLTLELMAYEDTKKFDIRASDTMYEYIANVVNGFEYKAYEGLGNVKNQVSSMSDEFSMAINGIPTFRTSTDPFVTENIYHSQFDNEETTSIEKYAEGLAHYGRILVRLDRLPVAPYDLKKTADKYMAEIDFDAIEKLGLSTDLRVQAQKYSDFANEMYGKNALILKTYDSTVAKGTDVNSTKSLVATYNQKMRNTVGTIIMGTTHLDEESVAYQIPFYLDLYQNLNAGILALEKGDGKAASDIFENLPGSYYADFEEYETWYATNRDNFNCNDPNRDIYWAEKIKVQYVDHYKMTRGLDEKVAKNQKNFDSEIKTAKEFSALTLENLKKAVGEDTQMLQKANAGIPSAEADQLIEALK